MKEDNTSKNQAADADSISSSASFKNSSQSGSTSEYYYHETEKPWIERLTHAFMLIVIGLVLFLNTSGNLSWSVWWEFIKFWPIFIISAGISLMLSFSRFSKGIAEIVNFLIFVTFLFFAAVNTNSGIFTDINLATPKVSGFIGTWFINTDNTNITRQESVRAQDYPAAESQDIYIEQKIGEMNLTTISDNNVFFAADVRSTGNRDSFELTKKLTENVLTNSITTTHSNGWYLFYRTPVYNYVISNVKPVKLLDVEINAGKGDINFTEPINISEISAKVDAGDLSLAFSDNSLPKAMSLEVNAGNMNLSIPAGTGISVVYDVGVGNCEIPGMNEATGIDRKGEYQSDNWSTAVNKVTLNVKVGVGNFELEFK